MHSFLMIGQSNMAGRGIMGEVPEIESNGMMFMLRNGRWKEMNEPINPDGNIFSNKQSVKGISLAASFAEKYSREYNEEIGLIPCADGGTKLDDWAVGGLLYDNAVMQSRLAQRTGIISGVLWHQGESDSKELQDAQQYEGKFLHIIKSLQRDLGIEGVPVIVGELGSFFDPKLYPFINDINMTLEKIANEYDNIALVSSKGLTCNDDKLHFNSVSLREFGNRYFEQFKKMQSISSSINKKRVMLIGDSVRLGYQNEVAMQLGSEYEVWGPQDNARFAKYTLNELDRYFKQFPNPDVIHWNNGLWDTAVVCKEDGAFTPVEEYIKYMVTILRELRKRTKNIIFATTTPVKEGSLNQNNEFIVNYNKRIVDIMHSEKVPVNDLYSIVMRNSDAYICDDKIHLSEAGKKTCGYEVANMIKKMG